MSAVLEAAVACSEVLPLDNHRCDDYHCSVMTARRRPANRVLPIEDHAFITLLKAADSLQQETEQLLKAHGLTGAQYNVLRILRGAEPEGLACSSIGERMISHDPDMTRLLDRMEKRDWITRERQTNDRRVIKTRITPSGLDLLKRLDQPIHELHKRQFRHISGGRVKELARLLEDVREGRSSK
jgi:DNA-binding MarR family transcriptional regulator